MLPSHVTCHASGLHHHMSHVLLVDCTITCTSAYHATYVYRASGLHHHTLLMDCTITRHIAIMLLDCSIITHHICAFGLHCHTPYSYHASGLQHHTPHIVLLNYTIIVIPSIQPVKTWEKIGDSHRPIGRRTVRSVTAQSDRSPHRLDRSPHSPIGHRTGSIGHRTVRSVTAQARSVTAQSDRSPHRLDRSPHSPIGHRTGSIGHRTGSIGHRTVRSVTAQARSVTAQSDRSPHRATVNNTVNSILGNFKLTETCQKRFSKTQNRISKNAFMYFWATVASGSLFYCVLLNAIVEKTRNSQLLDSRI